MKSLLLKDLYNIGHNVKSMLVVLIFLAFAIVPTSGPIPYMVMCAVLCSMMIVTTFTFDDACGWTSYALVLPVGRSRLVLAKYAALAVFCTAGILFGLAASSLGAYMTRDGIPAPHPDRGGLRDPGPGGDRRSRRGVGAAGRSLRRGRARQRGHRPAVRLASGGPGLGRGHVPHLLRHLRQNGVVSQRGWAGLPCPACKPYKNNNLYSFDTPSGPRRGCSFCRNCRDWNVGPCRRACLFPSQSRFARQLPRGGSQVYHRQTRQTEW